MKRTPSPLGRLVHKLRKKLGIYRTSLAEKSGVSTGTIDQLELGFTQGVREDTLHKLAAGLEVEPDVLMNPEAHLDTEELLQAPDLDLDEEDEEEAPQEEPSLVITIQGSFLKRLLDILEKK